jgi:acetyl esterase/lipase
LVIDSRFRQRRRGPGLTVQQLLLPQYSNPFDVPVLVSILNHLIMGTSGGIPAEPLLLGVGDSDGTGDGIMIDGDVEALAHEYCQRGVPVTFTVYPGLPHSDAAVPFEAQALAFLLGRFNGAAAPNGCASIGQGNSLAPLPQPSS